MRLVSLLLAVIVAPTGQAREVDPFLAIDARLADSAEHIDAHVSNLVQETLDDINSWSWTKVSKCYKVVYRTVRKFGKALNAERLRHWVLSNGLIQIAPPMTVSDREVLKMSIFRNTPVSVDRIINVSGVYIGVDKLSAALTDGLQLYRTYINRLKRRRTQMHLGELDILAMQLAAEKALVWEKGRRGGTSSGVISFADLEANYQGLLFYRSMCYGQNPVIDLNEDDDWVLTQPLKFSNYVNPLWDEFANPSFYVSNWDKIAPEIRKNCSKLTNLQAKDREEKYQASQPSGMAMYLEDLVSRGKLANHQRHGIPAVCSR